MKLKTFLLGAIIALASVFVLGVAFADSGDVAPQGGSCAYGDLAINAGVSSAAFPLLAPAGSAGAPSYSFALNPNTGMHQNGNSLAFAVNGNDVLALDPNFLATFSGGITTSGLITLKNAAGAVQASSDTSGTWSYTNANPNSYYVITEWDDSSAGTQFSTGGTASTNYDLASPVPTIAIASTLGAVIVKTSSSTQGGRVCYPLAYGIVKSTTITYRWRHIFYMPVASDGTNTYTAMVGNYVGVGSGTSADLPFAGPYISYSSANSGNWIMGSAVNNTRTTGNSATPPTFNAWSRLEISLANGTYTFIVNGVTIGTLLDSNITTSQASGQAATLGCIEIFPVTNFTTARTPAIDRSDFYVTGLSR